MSVYTQLFKSNGVWANLTAIGAAIDSAEALREPPIPDDIFARVERMRAILAFTGKRLNTVDPELVAPGALDQLGVHAANLRIAIEAFLADRAEGHVTNANTHADLMIMALAQICAPETASDLQGLREAAAAYREALESHAALVHRTLDQHIETLNEASRLQLATLTQSTERSTQEVAAAVAEGRNQLAAIEARTTELGNTITSEKARTDTVVTEFQAQFSAAQEQRAQAWAARQEQFNVDQAARKEAHDAMLSKYGEVFALAGADFETKGEVLRSEFRAQANQHAETFRTQAAQTLAEIKKHRDDVSKLVSVIGELGITSGYQKTADAARIAVRGWNAIAVSAMIALIIVAFKIFVHEVTADKFNAGAFAGRVAFTVTVGVLAAYAGTQASKYFSIERQNRKRALELAALEPFIASLTVEKQEEFRIKIGDRSFAQLDAPDDRRSPATIVDLLNPKKLKELKELVEELRKLVHGRE